MSMAVTILDCEKSLFALAQITEIKNYEGPVHILDKRHHGDKISLYTDTMI